MTRRELRKYLKLYPLIYNAVSLGLEQTEILLYGRKKVVLLPQWLCKLNDLFEWLVEQEGTGLTERVIERSYKRGEDDRRIISDLPITESGYYRLKRRIEGRLYEFFILLGDVTREDILSEEVSK